MALWYVDNAATGANNGTSWANAWNTLSGIAWGSISKSGDQTIYICGGSESKTYAQRLAIPWRDSNGNRLTVKVGQDVGHTGLVIINAPSGDAVKFGTDTEVTGSFTFDQAEYVTLDGEYSGLNRIKISGAPDRGIYFRYGPLRYNTVRNVDVEYCGYSGSQGHGIRMDVGGATGILIENCRITRNGEDGINWPDNEYYYGAVTIRNCFISGNQDDSIQMGGGVDVYNCQLNGLGNQVNPTGFHPDAIQGFDGYWRIYNNIFGDHTQEIFIQSEPAVNSGNMDNILIYNNLFYKFGTGSSKDISIGTNVGVTNTIYNNIVIANNTHMSNDVTLRFLQKTTGTTGTITNGLFANNIIGTGGSIIMSINGEGDIVWESGQMLAKNNLFLYSGTPITWEQTSYTSVTGWQATNSSEVTNNITGVANFRDAAALDFRLTAGSAAINAGLNLSQYFTTDFTGVNRGTTWDAGAFEIVYNIPTLLRVRASGG